MMSGAYVRYTDEAHAHIAEAFGLGDVLVRPTYQEASDAARARVMESAPNAVTVIHKPHKASPDPLDAIGSWGWKAR